MDRRAFTLIELLVVVSILAVLATVLLVAAGPLREKLRVLDTVQRMQQIMGGIRQYRIGNEALSTVVLDQGCEVRLRFAPLRGVIGELVSRHGLDLRTAKRAQHLPPNLGVRWEKQPDPKTWSFPDSSVDNVITFLDRQIRLIPPYDTHDFYDDVLPQRKDADYGELSFYGGEGVSRWLNRRATESPVGENLDRTLEVVPDAVRPPAWYQERWPNLRESIADVNGVITYTQSAWPASDWDRDPPGSVPPIWAWPWGRACFSRIDGRLTSQVDPHHLGELSPLAAVRLVQMSGALLPGVQGESQYREDRGVGRAWNDRWGNPLVPVFAASVAPRYDFDPNDTFRHNAAGATMPKASRQLGGGRDWLAQQARLAYGASQFVYLAIAAPGPALRDPLPAAWSAADDAVTLRRLWLQVREVTRADEWTAQGWSSPPWRDYRRETLGPERCIVTAPGEIR